jgi:NAD-dependent SIR2 family protein deacetylase
VSFVDDLLELLLPGVRGWVCNKCRTRVDFDVLEAHRYKEAPRCPKCGSWMEKPPA